MPKSGPKLQSLSYEELMWLGRERLEQLADDRLLDARTRERIEHLARFFARVVAAAGNRKSDDVFTAAGLQAIWRETAQSGALDAAIGCCPLLN